MGSGIFKASIAVWVIEPCWWRWAAGRIDRGAARNSSMHLHHHWHGNSERGPTRNVAPTCPPPH